MVQMTKLASASRLSALRALNLMDTTPEPTFDRVTRLVCAALEVEISAISLADDTRQFFKSTSGLPAPFQDVRETPLSQSFARHVIEREGMLSVSDVDSDPQFGRGEALPGFKARAYLGAPLHAPSGEVIGALCVVSRTPRQWTDDDRNMLTDFAHIVESELALRHVAASAGRFAEQHDTLVREYNHRAKNLFAVMQTLIRVSARDATSVADFSDRVQGRLLAYSSAHQAIETGRGQVNLASFVTKLLKPYLARPDSAALTGEEVMLAAAQAAPLGLIVHELATNSAKYGAFAGGEAPSIDWHIAEGVLRFTWTETAEVNPKATPGFGEKLLQAAIRQLDGTLERDWRDGKLVVCCNIPFAEPESRQLKSA